MLTLVHRSKPLWLAAAAIAALLSASPGWAQQSDLSAPRMGAWGFDLSGRDPAAAPGQDFYRFANGKWAERTEIPADRARFGAFDALVELSDTRSNAVIEAAAKNQGATGEAAQIGALYRSFMDEKTVEALGAKPLEPSLAAIRKAGTRDAQAELMGRSNATFHGSFFDAAIYDDQRDTKRYAVILGQAGLGLPDRDYYLTPEFAEKKAKYEAYIATVLRDIGWAEPEARARDIVALETRIAEVSWTRAERRDDVKMYNAMSIAELEGAAPGFPWRVFLKAQGLGDVNRVVVGEKTAFPKIAQIFAQAPIPVLQAWQAFTTADSGSPYMSKAFVDARFEFRNKTLSGQPEQRPRWKRAVALVNGSVGEAVGRLYVDAYFPAESKAKMISLVDDLKVAMRGRIDRLTWMGADTKAKAQEKLTKFNVKIAYPDKWRDYSALKLSEADLFGNVERAAAFEWNRRVRRLKNPVDRGEWEMTPQTVNAYYSPTKNEIVFPAAILQPPFFDPKADDAINYGAIGAVIGHEITHGFDDQGRQSDGDGMLRDWWTKEDAERFVAQTARLGAQYGLFEPLPGAKVRPELTMGENIADLGGLLLALDAYRVSLNGKPAPVIDGLTGDQRVFLAWAQVWRSKQRDDDLRQRLASDPHSPPYYRVNGVVRNIDDWYAAFGVKPGDALYLAPADRVRIW
jgi:putative endopeptidase